MAAEKLLGRKPDRYTATGVERTQLQRHIARIVRRIRNQAAEGTAARQVDAVANSGMGL